MLCNINGNNIMKNTILDSNNYIFDASTRRIIFDSNINLKKQDILVITNVSTNQMIYNFNCIEESGDFTGNVLTLKFDTRLMHNNDKLLIVISVKDKIEYFLEKILTELQTLNELLINKEN